MPDLAYRVDAAWDEVAGVWIATSDDVPGLCSEATTLETLIEIVLGLAPELLAANGVAEGAALDDVAIWVVAERVAVAHRAGIVEVKDQKPTDDVTKTGAPTIPMSHVAHTFKITMDLIQQMLAPNAIIDLHKIISEHVDISKFSAFNRSWLHKMTKTVESELNEFVRSNPKIMNVTNNFSPRTQEIAYKLLKINLIIHFTHPAMMTRYGWGAVRAQA